MKALPALGLAALGLALLPAAASAQVVISEINFKKQNASDDQWIELVNLGSTTADLSGWTLYQATRNAPGNYWFALPAGTKIKAGEYLRVHWLVPVKASTETDIYTGDTVFHFLFGYKAEPISSAAGAFALLNTQLNNKMNSPTSFEDWVSWGANGLKREDLAVQNGRWVADSAATAPFANDSLALIYTAKYPKRGTDWFSDASPSPNAHNHDQAATIVYGSNCSFGSAAPPTLTTTSIPAAGNRGFGFRVVGTAVGQNVVLVFAPAKDNGNLKLGPCSIWVAPPFTVIAVPAAPAETVIPAPLLSPGANGGTAFLQAVTLATPVDAGFSQGLQIDLGIQ